LPSEAATTSRALASLSRDIKKILSESPNRRSKRDKYLFGTPLSMIDIATAGHIRTNFADLKTNPLHDERLREALRPTLETSHWRSRTAVTFTLKQCVEIDENRYFLTQDICTKQFKRFMDRLNRSVYKNAFRHGKKRLRVIPIVEKAKRGRWHIHALIEPPPLMKSVEFGDAIRRCWLWETQERANPWAYRETDIGHGAPKWTEQYLLKFKQKDGLEAWSDSIDWYSFHNP
jgi:hypothetical protein